jgi:hypothetical protein
MRLTPQELELLIGMFNNSDIDRFAAFAVIC